MKLVSTLASVALSAALACVNATTETKPRNLTASATVMDLLPRNYCKHYAQDIDLPGSNIWPIKASQNKCLEYCLGTENCRAWTWNNYEGGTCWLKGGHGNGEYKPDVASGIVYAPAGDDSCNDRLLMLANCDVPGNDAGSAPGRDVNACKSAALSNRRSFTWSDYASGTCWFKDKFSSCQYAANKYSGYYIT